MVTLEELRAMNPPEDRDAYDRAYVAATRAGRRAELYYALRTAPKRLLITLVGWVGLRRR